jgi:hypothetical protein
VGEFIDEFTIREGTAGLVVTLALLWCVGATPMRWRCFSDVYQAE